MCRIIAQKMSYSDPCSGCSGAGAATPTRFAQNPHRTCTAHPTLPPLRGERGRCSSGWVAGAGAFIYELRPEQGKGRQRIKSCALGPDLAVRPDRAKANEYRKESRALKVVGTFQKVYRCVRWVLV